METLGWHHAHTHTKHTHTEGTGRADTCVLQSESKLMLGGIAYLTERARITLTALIKKNTWMESCLQM